MCTHLLASGKKNVLRYFFALDGDESLPSTVLPADDSTKNEFDYGYPPSPPICNFVKTNEQSYFENHEEIKYSLFVTERADTERIDRLFSLLEIEPEFTNVTAFGNFTTIIKSFLEKDNIKSDFLKYFFSRPELLGNLINHMVHTTGFQALASILNLKKFYSDANATASQFLVHRRRAYSQIFERLVSPTASVEQVEPCVELFVELITDSKTIWDSAHFIEKVLLDLGNLDLLIGRLSEREVGSIDEIRFDLLRLLTAMIDFANKKYDEEEGSSFEERKAGDEEKSPLTEDDGLKIEVNIVVPEVPTPVDEQRSNFIEKIVSRLNDIMGFIESEVKVHDRNQRSARC